MEEQPLTPQQCRAARAILDLPQSELARRARVDIETLKIFETAGEACADDVEALRRALEEVGVMMIATGTSAPAGGEGVRLAAPSQKSFDTEESEVVQYPEFMRNDAPPGAGG
ncbi:XRE family transcriptional regulator [Rhizobium sp. S152]|uniref:XRE family transcriptional regulator n=1 Tax=Rhizobium sp. S152 TaxID=3055038 RepID=UPI0025AA2D97|nr:XRE family transcriptional regulator [Rhizobium sp. S152]MDM9627689.1 XRE family transcriptional regulator [Rhizobium sp. S152]